MKVLSLTQPWATLVVIGAKKIETRSWATHYRGPLAIHAAKTFPGWAKVQCRREPFASALAGIPMDCGVILGIVDLIDVKQTGFWQPPAWVTSLSFEEIEFGNYDAGRYGWFLENARQLADPIPAKGALGLWNFDHPELEALNAPI